MAGHRRVSGRYFCPNDASNDTETATPSPRRSVRLDTPPREQQTPQPRSRPKNTKPKGTLAIAPTVMSDEFYKTEDESYDTENDVVGSPAPPKRRAPKIAPTSSFGTFARGIGLSTPLASLFTAPKSTIEEVQQEAGKLGLYTGMVYKPREIKEEESQRWVVVGRDPDAVDRVVDCQRKDVVRQLKLEPRTTPPVPAPKADTTAPKINVTCEGPSVWRMFIPFLLAVLVGGKIIYCVLLSLD